MYDCNRIEDLKRFMRDFYPDYQENLDLAKILCKKFIARETTKKVKNANRYKRVKIADIKPGDRVEIEGAVTDVEVFTYTGCPDKRKNGCRESQKREWVVTKLEIDDGTGSIWAMTIDEERLDVRIGYIVVARGYAKEWRDRLELSLNEVEVKSKPARDFNAIRAESASSGKGTSGADGECVNQLLDLVKEVGEMAYDAFVRALSRKCGLGEDAIDSLPVRVEEDKYGRVFVVYDDGK